MEGSSDPHRFDTACVRQRTDISIGSGDEYSSAAPEQTNTMSTESRDKLAEERTRLARERTTLAYIRTGFTSFLFGLALERLYTDELTFLVGVLFLLVGTFFITSGGVSYLLSRERTRDFVRRVEHSFYEQR